MSENVSDKKGAIEVLAYGDSRVRVLLGKQKRPDKDEQIRKSCFVFSMYLAGYYYLFHTLTRQILKVSPEHIEYFVGNRSFSQSVLEKEEAAFFYEHRFLVPDTEEEDKTYLELKDILVLKEELPRTITHYVILPTSTCNARCFYCFEQGMRYHKMTKKTVEDTISFIIAHRPQKGEIHIHWFGGEPTCAPENIDRICEGLREAGIEFNAEMTSNGSLFTEELAKHASEVWKVRQIQITLDGLAEEYEKRKRYTRALKHPFETVITGIHHLIAAGISVSVRLNVDENNIGDCFRCIDFLMKEFSEEERKKLMAYAHSLFSNQSEGPDACPVGGGSDELEEKVLEINEYLLRIGLGKDNIDRLLRLKSHYCMVTAPECNTLIDASGKLFACDAMPQNMCYGDVRKGFDPEAWKQVSAPCEVREECRHCVFLPQCTEFDRCPNRMVFDACRRQEERMLKSTLRYFKVVHENALLKQAEEKMNHGKSESETEGETSV